MDTESSSKLQFINNAFGDEVLYEVNRDAFDRTGSAAVFQKHIGKQLSKKDSLFIIIGTDSGLLVEWLLKEELPIGTRYLFIELAAYIDAIEARLPELQDITNIALVQPEEWKDYGDEFQFQEYTTINNFHVIQSVGAADAFDANYRPLHWVMEKEIREFRWQITQHLGGQVFTEKQLQNLADNQLPAQLLKGSCKGQTAILLGGGPSLDEFLPWIKEHRENLILIAVSRISRRLKQVDLQPDIVVSIDPHPVSFDVSKEMLDFDEKTILVHSYHITPLLLSQWIGPSLYFGDRIPWKHDENVENFAGQGPTVTNSALSVAIAFGFSKVILVGVDLCFSQEGFTHAAGSNERNAGPLLGNVGLQVETNAGNMADTSTAFAAAVPSMGAQAKHAETVNCLIINPASNAAKIPNVEHVTIGDIEVPTEKNVALKYLHKRLPANTPEVRIEHGNRMLKVIAKANGQLRAMINLADDALDCNDGLFGRNGKTADFKYKHRMDKIEKKLNREYKDFSPLVKNFGAYSFLHLVRPDKEREWTDDEIESWGRAYYESYKKTAHMLIKILEDTKLRLESRIAEETTHIDMTLLHKQWQSDKTPGRAQVWKHKHPEIKLNDLGSQLLKNDLEDFRKIINETQTTQAKQCEDNHTLAAVRSKLQLLFTQHEKEDLEQISHSLRQIESDEANNLAALADGYLAELSQDNDAALLQYNQLVDYAASHMDENDGQLPKTPELEDALKRMSHIALGKQDTEQVLLLLSTLASLSLIYQPQYAEILRISGDLQQAVDVYSEYLNRVPNDFGAMIKLGKIFQLAGADESATWAYNYVLEKNPDNQAAQTLLKEVSV